MRADLPAPIQAAVENAALVTRGLVGRTVADVERDLILDTLDHCLGNRTHAANILGISIRTLRNKLREYGSAGLAIPQHGEARMAG
jgi:DNA-binding NtrC family response regulator